ncbi:MAG TPA: DCC1-like thiol-disulfide oxidoreductase family protein, partial [Sphingobacteriaceae bacterium]
EGKFRFASLQSSAAADMLTGFNVQADAIYSILVLKGGRLYDRSDALIEIARDLPGIWKVFTVVRFLPKGFRDALYKLVANNRYRIFGKQESCMLPTPGLKSRFLS